MRIGTSAARAPHRVSDGGAPRLLSRITLRQRVLVLAIVGGLFSGVVVQSALVGLGQVNRSNEAVDRISRAQRYHQDGDMMHDALRADVYDAVLVHQRLGVDTPGEAHLQIRAHVAQFRADLAKIQALHLPARVDRALDDVRLPLVDYIASAERIAALAETEPALAIEDLPRFEEAFNTLATVQARVTAELQRERERTQEVVEHSELAARRRIVVASLLALLGLLVLLAMLHRVTHPISAIARSAERLGAGDFSVRVPASGVPEIDEVAVALSATAQRLGELIGRERSFSADVSHQLRTPVTAIRLRLEQTLDGADPRAAAGLRDCLELLDRLESTVEHLLAHARNLPVPRQRLDVRRALVDAAVLHERSLARQRRGVEIVCDDELPEVAASETAIAQILDVLMSNAVMHGAGMVTLRARDTGAGVSIEVSDEGPGVAGDADDIFRRHSASASGHGIGLSLASSLAEAEGARLLLQRRGPHPTFALMLLTTEHELATV